MNCPKCGHELSNEAKFCPNCGQKVFKKLFCRECGETLPKGARFCEKCGAPVDLVDPSDNLLNEAENNIGHAEEIIHIETSSEIDFTKKELNEGLFEEKSGDDIIVTSETDFTNTPHNNKNDTGKKLNDVYKNFDKPHSNASKEKKQRSCIRYCLWHN